ncbi:MAG: hypothetical protein ACLUEK_07940 [Oscillospiraceae bacterium]
MAAASIVVADTGDEAHFESALLSGSREGVEGVESPAGAQPGR